VEPETTFEPQKSGFKGDHAGPQIVAGGRSGAAEGLNLNGCTAAAGLWQRCGGVTAAARRRLEHLLGIQKAVRRLIFQAIYRGRLARKSLWI
jgi:hypothetical protein